MIVLYKNFVTSQFGGKQTCPLYASSGKGTALVEGKNLIQEKAIMNGTGCVFCSKNEAYASLLKGNALCNGRMSG